MKGLTVRQVLAILAVPVTDAEWRALPMVVVAPPRHWYRCRPSPPPIPGSARTFLAKVCSMIGQKRYRWVEWELEGIRDRVRASGIVKPGQERWVAQVLEHETRTRGKALAVGLRRRRRVYHSGGA